MIFAWIVVPRSTRRKRSHDVSSACRWKGREGDCLHCNSAWCVSIKRMELTENARSRSVCLGCLKVTYRDVYVRSCPREFLLIYSACQNAWSVIIGLLYDLRAFEIAVEILLDDAVTNCYQFLSVYCGQFMFRESRFGVFLCFLRLSFHLSGCPPWVIGRIR